MISIIEETNELEILNVIPVFRENRIIKFITSISIADIHKVYDRLYYDENTQRGYKEVKNKNSIVKKRIESKQNIMEMEQKIRSSFFDGGTLTWNVRLDNINDKTKYEYIPEESKIIIKEEILTLPDSSQRHVAIFNLRNYFLTVDQEHFCFPLQVCLYTLAEEQNLFSEINGEGTKASKTRALYLSNTYKSLILKDIINESVLKNNVETKTNFTTNTDKLVTFGSLYSAMFDKNDGVYRHLDDDDVKAFKDWMIKFWNYLSELRPNELSLLSKEERREIKKKSLVDSSLNINALIVISKALQGNKNWKTVLQRINKPYKVGIEYNGDVFSLENPIWHTTVCNKMNNNWRPVINKRTQKYFTKILLQHLSLVND